MRYTIFFSKGQALISLLYFMLIAIVVTTAAVLIMVTSSISSTNYQEGTIAYEIAESGIENALLRLLRNPNYAGETLTLGSGTVQIQVTVTGVNANQIIATGTNGNYVRKIQVDTSYFNNQLTILDWKEIYQ